MKRRTLDMMFSIGGLGLAVVLLILGLVMTSNASFAKDYVKDQLSEQQISFKPAAALTDEEKQSACLVAYAGQALTTGKQAECYANEFIGLHVKASAGGETYATIGTIQSGLRTQVADAEKTGAANLSDLQAQLATVTAQRESLFKGETLRGLLLTSYGFSVFGVKGGEVANLAYVLGGVMLILSLAGMYHAVKTPKTKGFALPEISLADSKRIPAHV
jgi:hypothetical protein